MAKIMFQLVSISLILIWLMAKRSNGHICTCDYLIYRSFVSKGCGHCAKCWWNLHFYSATFNTDPNHPAMLDHAKECVNQIPTISAFYENKACEELHLKCIEDTEVMFEEQCLELYGPGTDEVLPKPEVVDDVGLAKYKAKIHEKYKPPPKFTGSTSYFYPRTCPSHHRRYEWTYYLLFAAATKKHNVVLTEPWTEELATSRVAILMDADKLNDAANAVKENFKDHGFDYEGGMWERRFCGHSDIFICVEKPKIP